MDAENGFEEVKVARTSDESSDAIWEEILEQA